MKKCRNAMSEALERRVLLTTYYVSPSGSDSAAGTSAGAAFATLQHAADLARAGDVVNALPGTYASGFSLGWDFAQNGTPSAPITFNGSGATITGRNGHTADAIDLEGTSYVAVNGFTITNPSGAITRAGIRAVEAGGVVIENNNVNGMGTWGIFTGFTDDLTVANNVAANSVQQHGIYVSNSSQRPVITGNIVYGNHDCGIQINADASQGGSGISSGALIAGNVIHDNGAGGGAGINLDGVQRSRIENNLMYNNHASGISLFMIDGAAGSKNNVVVNNTIAMAADARWDVNINSGSTGNVVYNNILYNASSHGSIAITADSMTGFVSDYNLVVNLMSNDGANNAFLTLSQWRTQTGQDAHSVISTPGALFVNSAGNDYHLKAGSVAVDAGTSLASPDQPPGADIEGNLRPQGAGYDIGAYELARDVINGTGGNDSITLARGTNPAYINWTMGTASGQMLANDASGLTINGNGGMDGITVNYANGSPWAGVVHLNGVFTVSGLSGADPLVGTTLEVGRSTVYFAYGNGGSSAAAIAQALAAGYHGGAWNGPAGASGAITSAAAASGPVGVFAVGFADSGDAVVAGQAANTVEVRYTLAGDANLDGVVDSSDAILMTRNYLVTGKTGWDQGNFNYDSVIDMSDAVALQRNYGSRTTEASAAVAGTIAVVTPESNGHWRKRDLPRRHEATKKS